MKIAIEINDIIRNVFLKASQVYEKFYLDSENEETTSEYDENNDEWVINESEKFEYGLNLYSSFI